MEKAASMREWNKYTEEWLGKASHRLKERRVRLFIESLGLGPDDLILDLGSYDGSYLGKYYPYPHNVVLADIKEEPLKRGVATYGMKGYAVIQEDGSLPFGDRQFDAVWCNSVIEHVTVGYGELGRMSNAEFAQRAERHQRRFAAEIARIGRKYFVQTPYLHFPVEAHSWLPFIQYLPQETRWSLGNGLRRVWVKQWTADFLLYDKPRFRAHFPDATEFRVERVFGAPKALIAIKN